MEPKLWPSGSHPCRGAFGKALVAAVVVGICVFTMHVGVGAAQGDLVTFAGRVLWIGGNAMVVAPYADGSAPVKVDLSQARLDEYLTLTTGDSVTVTGTIPDEDDRIIATSIRSR
jgi:hypothetical protein